MNKKILTTVAVFVFASINLIGCGEKSEPEQPTESKSVINDTAQNAMNKANDAVKTSEDHAKKLEDAGK